MDAEIEPGRRTDSIVALPSVALVPTVREQLSDGVRLSETIHPPRTELELHAHRHPALTFVIRGRFEERVDGTRYHCRPLSLLLKQAGARHSNRYGRRGARSFFIELIDARHAAWAETALAGRPAYAVRHRLAAPAAAVYAAFALGEPALRLPLEELLVEVAAHGLPCALPSTASRPSWLGIIEQQLHDGFRSPAIGLATLASEAGVHPIHLARIFRRHHHCSVGDYVQRLRLEEGVRRVAEGSESLAEIAVALGYSDQSHFTRVFRARIGAPPGRFRRAWRTIEVLGRGRDGSRRRRDPGVDER